MGSLCPPNDAAWTIAADAIGDTAGSSTDAVAVLDANDADAPREAPRYQFARRKIGTWMGYEGSQDPTLQFAEHCHKIGS